MARSTLFPSLLISLYWKGHARTHKGRAFMPHKQEKDSVMEREGGGGREGKMKGKDHFPTDISTDN